MRRGADGLGNAGMESFGKARAGMARQARCSGAWPGGAVLGKAGKEWLGLAR